MNQTLKEKIMESLSAILPITFIVLALSILLVPLEIGAVVMFMVGAVMLIIGMGMFQLGAEISMSPIGEGIGIQLTKSRKISTIAIISFIMGLLITIAEPDLQVLSEQVPGIDNHILILTVAVGVGVFLALSVLRIVLKISLSKLLFVLYAGLIILSVFIPKQFLSVAFDSGGVTTGPITVPFIMAMGVGISMIRSDKNAQDDSFGLVALSSIGPILAVMILSFFCTPQEIPSTTPIPDVNTMRDVAKAFTYELPHFAKEVAISILPVIAMFFIFQMLTHRYHKRQRLRISVGFLYTYLGLVLFLCGVNVGFAPVGSLLGSNLATGSYQKYLLIPIGMIIGYFIVKAEPAIQILNKQVQSVTEGSISAKAMNRCMSVSVSISLGLAMLRVLTGIPISSVVIPGYMIALVMSLFTPKIFIGIAFDSGGVASGPITSTFLLPLCIGACTQSGGDIMTDAFGVVALVALTPLIAIQIMGILYRIKLARFKDISEITIPEDDNSIIEFEEATT
ncbi:MAG: DUF1538 domain-containing protein [Clostridia bacterium]|nr:DUF1538 domain-containing protein [Clostridia bacterium]